MKSIEKKTGAVNLQYPLFFRVKPRNADQDILRNGDRLWKKTQKVGICHVVESLFLCIVKIRAELS